MDRLNKILFLFSLLFFITPINLSQAQSEIPFFVAPQVDLFFHPDGNGPVDKLFKEFERQNLISGYTVLPTLRARRHFLSNENSCYTPTEKSILDIIDLPQDKAIVSEPFNLVTGILVFREDHPALNDDKILENTTIGAVGLASDYGTGGFKFRKINAPNPDKLVELYDRGRFEGVYLFLPNGYIYPKAQRLLEETKQFQKILWQGENAITCHIQNKENVEKLNKAIQDLKESGKLKEILGNIYNFQ